MQAIYLKHTASRPVFISFPSAITPYAFDAADRLSGYILSVSGIAPERGCTAEIPEDASLIVLGSAAPAAKLDRVRAAGIDEASSLGEGVISSGNGVLAVMTGTERVLTDAVELIISSISFENGKLMLPAEPDRRRITLPGYLKYLPVPAYGDFAAERQSHMNCDQTIYTGADKALFEGYLDSLSSRGFEKEFERECCGNLFARYIRGETSAYVYYTPYNSTLRIFAEPSSNIHREAGFNAPEDHKALMTVIGARWSETSRYLNCDSGSGNMGYVFRTEDGRFILVDGGMELGDYAEKIIAILEEQSGGGKPRIACWFLSHTHIDHTGAFLKIADKYRDRVIIDEVVCNFPSYTDAEAYREAWNTRRVSEAVYHAFPGVKFSKLHTGELLKFGKTTVEVLYTQDDAVSRYFSILNDGYTLNTASLCIRLYTGGNTVILPADCDEVPGKILTGMYGDYLKSDILQVCHHGGWGGSTELYSRIDPELAIFSTSDELLPKYLQIKYNHDLVYDMNVVEVHNNADRCRVFELPYHPSEKRIPADPAGDILYTKAKQLEALASIEKLRAEQKK